jgi:hypothetical protein
LENLIVRKKAPVEVLEVRSLLLASIRRRVLQKIVVAHQIGSVELALQMKFTIS